VATIVLRELDLPQSSDMQGVAPPRCFESAKPAPAAIATWGRRGRASGPTVADDDPELLLRLKSLGYVQ
jgi:hypothetical protein